MKKKCFKRVTSIAIAFATAISMSVASMAITPEQVVASVAYTESEGNDTNVTANQIQLNQKYTATMYAEDGDNYSNDIDWFKFEIQEYGLFDVTLTVPDNVVTDDINGGWDIKVYRSDAINDIGYLEDVKSTSSINSLTFGPGVYYIKVTSDSSYDAPLNVTYQISVNFSKVNNWEQEDNDTNAKATSIPLNQEVKGAFFQSYSSHDVDWYKFTIAAQGTFSIRFRVDDSTDVNDIKEGWELSVYDSNYSLIRTFSNIQSTMTTIDLPYPKGTYYLKVSPNPISSTYEMPLNCVYNLKVNYKASKVWESENNNKSSKADQISLNTTYRGYLCSDDIDWYKFTVKESGKVTVNFAADKNVNIEDIGYGWNVYIYNSKDGNNPLKYLEEINTAETAKLTLNLKKGTYYIKISQNSYGAATDCIYTIRANFALNPGKTTLSSVKSGKKSASLTWKKNKNATGYYVYRSTSKNGKYKKVATISKNSTVKYTDKNLKSGKKYYYYVVSYRTENGMTVVGSKSSVKVVSVK